MHNHQRLTETFHKSNLLSPFGDTSVGFFSGGGSLTLVQQLLGVGRLFALRLKKGVDAPSDQVLPPRPALRPQSAGFYGNDLSWSRDHRTSAELQKTPNVVDLLWSADSSVFKDPL